MICLKPFLYLVTEMGEKINEILVRALTGESRASAWRPAGIHTCSPAGLTSVSAEHKNRCSFVSLSCRDVSASHTKFQALFFTYWLFTAVSSLQFSQSVSNACRTSLAGFSHINIFLIISCVKPSLKLISVPANKDTQIFTPYSGRFLFLCVGSSWLTANTVKHNEVYRYDNATYGTMKRDDKGETEWKLRVYCDGLTWRLCLWKLFFQLYQNNWLAATIISIMSWSADSLLKNTYHEFPEPKLVSLNILYSVSNRQKPREIHNFITWDKEKWKISTI